ncbi:uncharacterized protein LOC110869610 [Helianthus annuus]|uniref:uncharacterized protein LOC110869610 n=1 Tax=Helianthus annuus TaxID=4232 RepID=UPI000B90A32B|nr:uncharacterized protein LOC110869610 [Helianthus annuus]
MREFFAYQIQDRISGYSLVLNGRRLLQQFLVDAYTMIESERPNFIRGKQKNLRSETFENLQKYKHTGQENLSNTGQKVILPSSFTGGARFMQQNYLDAMALCKWFGYPDFFITITCNPKWPEISRFLKDTSIKPEDRPDILCQLFKMKLDSMIKDLKDNQFFGEMNAVYRRRDCGHTVIKKGVQLDNRSVVPYNKSLLRRYQAHINVEWCNQAGSIKYLFKYINKGPDWATAVVFCEGDGSSTQKQKDEIKEYYDCRYISACEASWRIFTNEVHYRFPAVMRLPFHLPGQHNVVYGADDDIEDVLSKPSVASSMFLKWFELNQRDEEACKLTYVEFPSKFVWNVKDRCWQIRKRYKTVGRIHSVSVASGEPYYLRILLNKVRGPKSFEDIRTVNGELFPTFKDACYAMGILDDDNEYVEAIKEASFDGHCRYLRALFATMLLTNTISRPEFVWDKTWHLLGDGILYRRRKETRIPDLTLPEDQLKNQILFEIENYLISNGSSLKDSMCHIKPNDDVADLLKEAKLIIWDEAPMVHKHAFEALDRTMKDVLSSSMGHHSELPFGGKVIVFGGDFRQILPVIPNGNVGSENDGEALIEIPDDLAITDSDDPIQSLIDFVYPSILENYKNSGFFSERAILAPKNEVVHEINDRLLSLFPGEEKEYLSSDSICQTEQVLDSFQQDLYSADNLNALKIAGLPNHRLVLKVGVPVILLRNIDQQRGLCNGTRLQITFLGKRVIEAEVISGGNIGTRVYIPRISMIPSDKKIPFQFQRRQFPLSVCFAMTINKSQGQSLSRVGLYLKDPVFSHGQLYVALSRVKTREGVKILAFDADGKPSKQTSNVVYKEIFGNL